MTSLRTDHPSGVPCPLVAASHPLGTDSTGTVRSVVLAVNGVGADFGRTLEMIFVNSHSCRLVNMLYFISHFVALIVCYY